MTPLKIPGSFLIHHDKHTDLRGSFQELWRQKDITFVQDNVSISKGGVLRGLHMQTNNPQGKLVTCLKGSIVDVFVDLRQDSPTFLQYCFVYLQEGLKSVYIPPGCAHGFLTLKEEGDEHIVHYKCTTFYDKESDGGIIYNDPTIEIPWHSWTNPDTIIVSDKDKSLPEVIDYIDVPPRSGAV